MCDVKFHKAVNYCQTTLKPQNNNHKILISICQRQRRYDDKTVNGKWIIEHYFCHNTSAIQVIGNETWHIYNQLL